MDGGFENPRTRLYREYITTDNICQLLLKYHGSEEGNFNILITLSVNRIEFHFIGMSYGVHLMTSK